MDNMPRNLGLASSLKDARLAKGYNLEDLAVTTGLTVAEIEAVENGEVVPSLHRERIEHARQK